VFGAITTFSVSGDATTRTSTTTTITKYQSVMSAHGFTYWLLHIIAALLAAACWEYRHVLARFLHL
jgi:hypothetical protein